MALPIPGATGEAPAKRHRFTGLTGELCPSLEVQTVSVSNRLQTNANQSSLRKTLTARDQSKPYLPGQPRIRLDVAAGEGQDEVEELLNYLRKSHLTNELDRLLPFMKYIFVQTPSYRHIMPLHHQRAHARQVVVNEHPGLHLVWYYDKIFIKPIPSYFYSKAFWEYLEDADPEVYKAAVGFMRSYYFIIQYAIDFDEACATNLVPKKPDGDHPSYEEFCKFIAPFRTVDDDYVCRRYHYGELRLSRINRTSMIFKGHLAYFHIYPQWGSFLTYFLAPIITVFAVASVVLNSMQVALAAQQTNLGSISNAWAAFTNASLYFPIIVICLIAAVLVFGLIGILFMGINDVIWAKSVRKKKKNGDREAGEKSHGMIW